MALNSLSLALSQVGRFEEAITALQDAVTIFRETSDRPREGMARCILGGALCQVRRFEKAITALQDAATIFRETSDRPREGMALANLSSALLQVQRFDEAITALQDVVTISRETSDRLGEGMALTSLGISLSQVGRLRGGDHRAPGRGYHLPRDQRPPPRGHDAGHPRSRQGRTADPAQTVDENAAPVDA